MVNEEMRRGACKSHEGEGERKRSERDDEPSWMGLTLDSVEKGLERREGSDSDPSWKGNCAGPGSPLGVDSVGGIVR